MSTDELETGLRRALHGVAVPDGLQARLRAGVLEEVARSSARRVRRPSLRRGAGWALTALAVAGCAAVLGLLVVAAPTDPPAASATTGVEYVLRARSYDGVSGPDPAAALADVLRARPLAGRVPGLTVTAEGDRVTVFVPGTHDVRWIDGLLQGLDLAVYDNSTSLVAAGAEAGPVLDAVRSAGGPATAWYAIDPARPAPAPAPAFIDGPFATEAAARARAATVRSGLDDHPQGYALGVGGGVHLAMNYGDAPGASVPAPYIAALRDPVVPPGAIDVVGGSATVAELTIAPELRVAVARRVAALDRGAGETLTMITGSSAVPGARFQGYDAATGIMSFALSGGSERYPMLSDTGGVSALIDVEARVVGPAPPRRGTAVDAAEAAGPVALANPGEEPRPGSVLRVLGARAGGESWTGWTWVGVDGDEVIGVAGSATGPLVTTCAMRPEDPLLAPCVGTGGGDGRRRSVIGRTGDRVAGLTARYADGTTVDAVVQNGWFLLALPQVPVAPARITATDGAGSVIGTVFPATPDLGLIFDPPGG